MTTSIKKELSRDLVRNADWPLFSARPDLKATFPLAAYTLTWRRGDEDTSTLPSSAAKHLERRFVRVTEGLGCTLQAFVVHSTVQPRTATVLYRKIWKALQMGAVPGAVEVGFENLIECASGVRFASLANVPMVAIPWMISTAQGFDVVIPLLLRRPFNTQDLSALELARIALPPNGCSANSDIDWAAFSCHVAMHGGICVRGIRDLGAREVAVDFFGSEADMPALVQILESDDGLSMFQVQ